MRHEFVKCEDEDLELSLLLICEKSFIKTWKSFTFNFEFPYQKLKVEFILTRTCDEHKSKIERSS